MDPATISLIVTGIKNLNDVIQGIKDKSTKNQLESLKSILEMSKAQLEQASRERDAFKAEVKELKQERDGLAEKVAYHDATTEYDRKDGLFFKKGSGEGPYCPVDQYAMIFQGHEFANKKWQCPKCKTEAKTVDPELADGWAGGTAILRTGPNPAADWRGRRA